MSEVNAAGARIGIRDNWRAFLFMFLTSGLYRVFWYYGMNRDLAGFGRAREVGQQPWIRVRPALAAITMIGGLLGGLFLWISVFPWSDAQTLSTGGRWSLIGCALVLLAPTTISMFRTRARIRTARRLGGLAQRRLTSLIVFVPLLVVELLGVPVAMFALTACLNQLWRQYPALHDEDIYGELAPVSVRAALTAERPQLAEQRELAAAHELESPDVNPVVTLLIAVVCIVLFVIEVVRFGFNPNDHQIISMGALDADVHGIWWHFIAANFLHANVQHILGNLPILVFLGSKVERAFGSRRFVLLVILGVIGSSVGSLLVFPHEPGLGVSGVIFAVVGAAMGRDLRARVSLGRFGWTIAVVGGLGSFASGINWGAHGGGLVAGIVFAIAIRLFWRVPETQGVSVRVPTVCAARSSEAPLSPRVEGAADTVADLAILQAKLRSGGVSVEAYARDRAALLTPPPQLAPV